MKQNSTLLLQFLKNEFPELLKKRNGLRPSKRSVSVLGKIYDLMLKADKLFHSRQKNIQSENVELKSKDEDIHLDSFIPREIVMKIKNSDRFQQTYNISHNGDKYNINFVYPIVDASDTKSRIQYFFQDAVYKIFLWLYVADKYASNHCSSIMNLHFFFTDHMKRLGSVDLEALDMIHVNTAFTSSCSKETDIHLFRREEWFKVFIHETFHNLGFDFSEMNCVNIDSQLNAIFPLNNKFKAYESYCEIWAESVHNLFLLFFKGYDKSTTIAKFETILQYEAVYSVFQCVKMLNHYHITYDQLTNKLCQVSKKARDRYRENSPVFSYYVIKTILLLGWNDFMEWCLNNNQNLFQFNKTSTTQMSFVNLISGLYKSECVLKNITFVENWFKMNKHGTHDPFIMRNMRMTLYA